MPHLWIKIYLFIILNVLCSCSKNQSKFGAWKLEKISGESLSKDEQNTFFHLKENGNLIREISNRKGNGIWKLQDNQLVVTYDNKKEYYSIVQWNESKLIITQESDSFYFSK